MPFYLFLNNVQPVWSNTQLPCAWLAQQKKKKEKAASTYLDMHSLSSAVAWNMPACFFLVHGCKTISRAAPLHTTRASLPHSSPCFSGYIFFGQFSSQYSTWSDSVHMTPKRKRYMKQIFNNLSVLSHLDCVLCPKRDHLFQINCIFPLGRFVLTLHYCKATQTLSQNRPRYEICRWYHCNHVVLAVR